MESKDVEKNVENTAVENTAGMKAERPSLYIARSATYLATCFIFCVSTVMTIISYSNDPKCSRAYKEGGDIAYPLFLFTFSAFMLCNTFTRYEPESRFYQGLYALITVAKFGNTGIVLYIWMYNGFKEHYLSVVDRLNEVGCEEGAKKLNLSLAFSFLCAFTFLLNMISVRLHMGRWFFSPSKGPGTIF